jgi:hypothetical protein
MPAIAITSLSRRLKDCEDMENLGREKAGWLKTFLELPHGMPDKNAFQRLFARIDPGESLKSLETRLWEVKSGGRRVNIDGKTTRGSGNGGSNAARHIVSAWAGEQRLALGQVKTEEKSDEITAIPELLDLLDIAGSTATIGATGCQKAMAQRAAERRARHAPAVKESHPELYRQ